MLRVRSVRQATEVTSRCRVPGERLGTIGPMLLIERRVVLLLVHRGSQVLGAGTIQYAAISRPTLQNVAMSPLEGVGVVVNRADVPRIEAALIHARLTELANRRRALRLATKVRRTLMHLVLSSPKAADVPSTETAATDVATTKTAAAHVSTAAAEAATTHMASAGMTAAAAVTTSSAMSTTATVTGC